MRSLFPAEHLTTARVDRAVLVDAVKRVSLVAERNTAVQLSFADCALTLDAGSGDEAMASESIEAVIAGDDITTGFNPQFLLDGLTAIEAPYVELAFTTAAKPVVISGTEGGRRGGRRRLPLPADATPPAVLTRTDRCTTPPPNRRGAHMDIGLIGLGKMGGNMRTRLRNAGHTVVGYDRNPDLSDVDDLAALVDGAAQPQGGLGDGARR